MNGANIESAMKPFIQFGELQTDCINIMLVQRIDFSESEKKIYFDYDISGTDSSVDVWAFDTDKEFEDMKLHIQEKFVDVLPTT